MASLNHVCMWSEHGWVKVTAEEAAAKHPGGTVSAHNETVRMYSMPTYLYEKGDKE